MVASGYTVASYAQPPRAHTTLPLVLLAHVGAVVWLLNAPQSPIAITNPTPLNVRMLAALPTAMPTPPAPTVAPTPPLRPSVRIDIAPRPAPKRTESTMAPTSVPEAPSAVSPAPTSQSSVTTVATNSVPTPVTETTAPRFDAAYLDNPRPAYPPLSRRLGEQGRVLLAVQVGADGRALDVALHTSSGSPRLDAAALAAVRDWRFVPARRGEQAIAASVHVPITFSLKD